MQLRKGYQTGQTHALRKCEQNVFMFIRHSGNEAGEGTSSFFSKKERSKENHLAEKLKPLNMGFAARFNRRAWRSSSFQTHACIFALPLFVIKYSFMRLAWEKYRESFSLGGYKTPELVHGHFYASISSFTCTNIMSLPKQQIWFQGMMTPRFSPLTIAKRSNSPGITIASI